MRSTVYLFVFPFPSLGVHPLKFLLLCTSEILPTDDAMCFQFLHLLDKLRPGLESQTFFSFVHSVGCVCFLFCFLF